MTARRTDLTIAAAGIVALAAVAGGAAGRAWYHAVTAPVAADRLAHQDAAVALLALGLLGLYPVSTIIVTLVRPATHHSSRQAGTTPVERGQQRSGSRRTSPVCEGWAGLVRPHAAGGGDFLPLVLVRGRRRHKLPARCPRFRSPKIRRVVHTAPGRETPVGGAR